jgi:hypothetical protein
LHFFPCYNLPDTVIAKKFADNNICGNNICGHKMTLFLAQKSGFPSAKIFTANIFIRKNFQLYGRMEEEFFFP